MNNVDIALIVFFILYVVLPIQTPDFVAKLFDNVFGILALLTLIGLLQIYNRNVVVTLMACLVAYELIRRSSTKTGSMQMAHFLPTQQKKDAELKALNDVVKNETEHSQCLEHELAKQLVPISSYAYVSEQDYKPILSDTAFHVSEL